MTPINYRNQKNMTAAILSAFLFISTCQNVLSFSLESTRSHSKIKTELNSESENSRRSFLSSSSYGFLGVGISTAFPGEAWGSGGATAGKYTTIPIAKRRYYGRVQEAVHEFLEMGPAMLKKDMTDPLIQHFFDPNGAVIVEARRQDINGQCTKKNQTCKGAE